MDAWLARSAELGGYHGIGIRFRVQGLGVCGLAGPLASASSAAARVLEPQGFYVSTDITRN